jgi:RND family efflux transporter MFP subunit
MDRKKTLLLSLVILLAGGGITTIIFSTEPTATRAGATKETAMLVEVIDAEKGSFAPTITALGSVEAAEDIILSPRVSGEIIERSPEFTPGGFVNKGDELLKIDPADYRNILNQRLSELQQAEADYEIELGRQSIAQQDYEMLDDTLSNENRALVLRQPQLNAARSRVESARAAVEQAQLDLDRTTIRAPFDAYIISRNTNLGSQVAVGDELGRLVGLDTYWVEATIPLSKLKWLSIPINGTTGSEVTIRNRTAWMPGDSRTGRLYRLIGSLEDQTRLARVLITVSDPLAYQEENRGKPQLMIGSYVEAEIQASELEDVIRLSRDYVRNNDTVWVMENSELKIRDVSILFEDGEYAYITEGVDEGEKIITTNLATIVEGTPVRLESEEKSATAIDSSAE